MTDSRTELDDPIYAHIIERDDTRSAEARILEASVNGTPLTALCGHVWVPSRDPKKHPMCPVCLEMHEMAKQFYSNPISNT